MPAFHRKTAPGVRGGRVRKKNNWRQSPDCYAVPQLVPAIDRRRPGAGYRHVLLKRDIERFVNLLPHWGDISRGLDVIVLDGGRPDRDGWYDRGLLAVCAWKTNLVEALDTDWYVSHCELLARIGVPVEFDGEDHVARWTPETVRAYQLLHVFLHELGHHIDRMTTRPQKWCERGEAYAEQYAWAHEALIFDRYGAEFGLG